MHIGIVAGIDIIIVVVVVMVMVPWTAFIQHDTMYLAIVLVHTMCTHISLDSLVSTHILRMTIYINILYYMRMSAICIWFNRSNISVYLYILIHDSRSTYVYFDKERSTQGTMMPTAEALAVATTADLPIQSTSISFLVNSRMIKFKAFRSSWRAEKHRMRRHFLVVSPSYSQFRFYIIHYMYIILTYTIHTMYMWYTKFNAFLSVSLHTFYFGSYNGCETISIEISFPS